MDHVIINGELFPADDAKVSVFDIGFMRGVGAFETVRTLCGGLPHALHDHCERLWRTTKELSIPPFKPEITVRADIQRLYDACAYDELRLNLMVTPGINTHDVFESGDPTWVVIAKELKLPPESYYNDGIKVVTFEGSRYLPHLKTTNYLSGRKGWFKAKAAGAQEAIYVNDQGFITEGVTSNILICKDGVVHEVADDRLPGITMAGVEQVAKNMGLDWQRSNITRELLNAADECWITSSVRTVMPVVKVDDQIIGNGKVGPLAKSIRQAYEALCIQEAQADAAAAQ